MSNGGPRLRVVFEPADYKGQEPSNLVFSEFRRALRAAKLFWYNNACNCRHCFYCFFLWCAKKMTKPLRNVINKC